MARIHHAPWRRGGVAASGARAAGRARAAHRRPHTPLAADDTQGQARLTAFFQELRELGWIDGRNVRIDTRWNASNPDEIRKYAAEFVALPPDVILAAGSPIVAGLQSEIRTVPIVFAPDQAATSRDS
jgi:hypothetical protein